MIPEHLPKQKENVCCYVAASSCSFFFQSCISFPSMSLLWQLSRIVTSAMESLIRSLQKFLLCCCVFGAFFFNKKFIFLKQYSGEQFFFKKKNNNRYSLLFHLLILRLGKLGKIVWNFHLKICFKEETSKRKNRERQKMKNFYNSMSYLNIKQEKKKQRCEVTEQIRKLRIINLLIAFIVLYVNVLLTTVLIIQIHHHQMCNV